ncbi:hypothetical protein HKX48_007861, partial [Thoreauomyces humboldtii]
LQHWHVHSLPKHAGSTPKTLDYIAMNRGAAKEGILNSRELRRYRQLNPISVTVTTHDPQSNLENGNGRSASYRKAPIPSDNDPRFTYGKPTRPSTPVGDLMTDKYQREWSLQQEKRLAEASRSPQTGIRKAAAHHAASTLAAAAAAANKSTQKKKTLNIAERDPKTLWKMSKFQKIHPHLDTWRQDTDPALDFSAAPRPLFRVVDDKWLGLPPRELTRPIYMQESFERQQRAALHPHPHPAAAATERRTVPGTTDRNTATRSVRFDATVPASTTVIRSHTAAAAAGLDPTTRLVPSVSLSTHPTSVHTKSTTERTHPSTTRQAPTVTRNLEVHAFPVVDDVTYAKAAAATTDEIATGHGALGSTGIDREVVKDGLAKGLPGLPGRVAGLPEGPRTLVV